MNIPEAKEVLEDIKRFIEPGDPPDEHNAFTIALVCMSYCDAIIKALGESEIAKLLEGD